MTFHGGAHDQTSRTDVEADLSMLHNVYANCTSNLTADGLTSQDITTYYMLCTMDIIRKEKCFGIMQHQ